MKSWKKPTPDQVSKAVALLSHVEQRRYFFDRLKNPEWILPLADRGFFKNPPAAVQNEIDGTIRFPLWPESRYLARMAPIAPDTVHRIAIEIDAEQNVYVQEDLSEIALALPAELAADFVNKVRKWLESPYQFRAPEKLGALVAHLAQGSQIESAFKLGKELFAVLPLLDIHGETAEGQSGLLPQKQRTHFFDVWLYDQVLSQTIGILWKVKPEGTFEMLCNLLNNALYLSSKDIHPADGSHIWRPVVEEDADLPWHPTSNVLVTNLVRISTKNVNDDPGAVGKIANELEKYGWHVFKRLVMHILSESPQVPENLLAERLNDISQIEEAGLRREYSLLLRKRYPELSHTNQDELLVSILKGPDQQEWASALERSAATQPSEEEISDYTDVWRRDRLAIIDEYLPEQKLQLYQDLVARHGPAKSFEHPAIGPTSVEWVTEVSPKTAEDLRSMSFSAILEYLRTWQPPDKPLGESVEALQRELTLAIAAQPQAFSKEAVRFKELDVSYVRTLLQGLHQAVEHKHSIDWSPVLDLCAWLIEMPLHEPDEDGNRDHGLIEARRAVPRLLGEGLKREEATEIPFQEREALWRILEALMDDLEPTPAYEARFGGSNMDPATLSINTTRGITLHAVMRYALWVNRHLSAIGEVNSQEISEFASMLEVPKVLDDHLNLEIDPSLAIRAVYGQWFPWVFKLAPNWARANVELIFPTDERQRDLLDAAWNSYVLFVQPFDDVLPLLEEHYENAIRQIGSPSRTWRLWMKSPDERLSEHLMTYYLRGEIELEGMVSRFFAKASDELRAHALRFVGQGIKRSKDEVEVELLKRLMALWSWTIDEVRASATSGESVAQLAAFGWWFISDRFDDSWLLAQLATVLQLAGKVEQEHEVVKRLASMAADRPLEVLQCFDLIVAAEEGPLGVYRWPDQARTIISSAIQSDDESTRQAGKELAEALGRRGFSSMFRDLLPD